MTNDSGNSVSTEKPHRFTREGFFSGEFDPKHINLIVQEGILLGGGLAAILLQVADSGVGQGVNEHSNFTYRVADRLRTTMTFVYCMSYGTPEERRAISDLVTKIHAGVNGVLDEGKDKGKRYTANDPELQMWVAATLYATAVQVYGIIFGEIKDDDLNEKIFQEYSILACSLQVPPEMWPENRAAFWEYWNKKVAEVEVTQHAKQVADDLMHLRHAPFYMRMFIPPVRVVTAQLLPERLRKEFNLNVHPKRYKVIQFMVKAMYKPLPLSMRSLPVKFYMHDMRKRFKHHQKIFAKA